VTLVTLNISEVADVVDDAISRHMALTRSRTKVILGDITSIRTSIQELENRLDSNNHSDDIESIEKKLILFEENLSSLGFEINQSIIDSSKRLEELDNQFASISVVENIVSLVETRSSEFDVVKDDVKQLSYRANEIEIIRDKTLEFDKNIIGIESRLTEVVTNFSNKLKELISVGDFGVFTENIHLELETTKNNINKISSRVGEISVVKNKVLELGKGLSDLEIKLVEIITERLQEFTTTSDFKSFVENIRLELEDTIGKEVDALDKILTNLETKLTETIADKILSLSKTLSGFVSTNDFKEFFDNTRLELDNVKNSISKISSRAGEINTIKNRISKFDDTFTAFEAKLEGLLQDKISFFERKLDTYTTTNDLTLSIENVRAEIEIVKKEAQNFNSNEETVNICTDIIQEEIEKLPIPRDGAPGNPGKDGVSVSLEDLKSFIEETISRLPTPKDGKDGDPGQSITINDVQPFIVDFIKSELSLIKPAKDGKDGKDGVGVASAMIDRDGNLFITCTNGETKSLGLVVGRDAEVDVDRITSIILEHSKRYIEDVRTDLRNMVDTSIEAYPPVKQEFDIDNIWSLVLDQIKHYESDRELLLKEYVDTSISNIPPPIIDMEYIQTYIINSINSLPKSESITVDDILPLVMDRFNDEKDDIAKIVLKNIVVPTIDNQAIHNLVKDEIESNIKTIDIKPPLSIEDMLPIITQECNNVVEKAKETISIEAQHILEVIPDEIAEKVAKGISILAESPIIDKQQPQSSVTVNITQPQLISKAESTLSRNKKIVKNRDERNNNE